MNWLLKPLEWGIALAAVAALACAAYAIRQNGYAAATAHYQKILAEKDADYAISYARLEAGYREQEQKGQALAAQVAKAEATNQQLLKEKKHAIRQATTGRACLDAGALRLLNSNGNASHSDMPASSGNALVADGAVATDTDVALWAADARRRYDACRGRIDALRQFFEESNK